MKRLISVDFTSRRAVGPDTLRSDELGYALNHSLRPGTAERIRATDDAGSAGDLELLYFPVTGRAGVAWRDAVWWLDAASPEEALDRWIAGEGRTTRRRGRPDVEDEVRVAELPMPNPAM